MEPGLAALHPPLVGRDPIEPAGKKGETTGPRQEGDITDAHDSVLQIRRNHRKILGIHGNEPEPPRERKILLHARLCYRSVSWAISAWQSRIWDACPPCPP